MGKPTVNISPKKRRKVPKKQRTLTLSPKGPGEASTVKISTQLVDETVPDPQWTRKLLDTNFFEVKRRWRTSDNKLKYSMACKLCAAVEKESPEGQKEEQILQDVKAFSFERHLEVHGFF